MARFLSALAYENYSSAVVIAEGATGGRGELDPPVLRQPRRPSLIRRVPPEIVSPFDSELALCLALMREAASSRSPALTFLSYWKTVEVAVGKSRFKKWVTDTCLDLQEAWTHDGGDGPRDWFAYLNESRIAAAHALPHGDDPFAVDPDDPAVRRRLREDVAKISLLARRAVEEIWPRPVADNDPPEELLGRNELWPPRN